MNEDWKIGDEIRDKEINTNAIIVGIYKDHYECIAYNGNAFDTFIVPKTELYLWNKTGQGFPQIAEMIKIMKDGTNKQCR